MGDYGLGRATRGRPLAFCQTWLHTWARPSRPSCNPRTNHPEYVANQWDRARAQRSADSARRAPRGPTGPTLSAPQRVPSTPVRILHDPGGQGRDSEGEITRDAVHGGIVRAGARIARIDVTVVSSLKPCRPAHEVRLWPLIGLCRATGDGSQGPGEAQEDRSGAENLEWMARTAQPTRKQDLAGKCFRVGGGTHSRDPLSRKCEYTVRGQHDHDSVLVGSETDAPPSKRKLQRR